MYHNRSWYFLPATHVLVYICVGAKRKKYILFACAMNGKMCWEKQKIGVTLLIWRVRLNLSENNAKLSNYFMILFTRNEQFFFVETEFCYRDISRQWEWWFHFSIWWFDWWDIKHVCMLTCNEFINWNFSVLIFLFVLNKFRCFFPSLGGTPKYLSIEAIEKQKGNKQCDYMKFES